VKKLQAPRGTLDVLPPGARRRLDVVAIADDVLGRAGYEPMETPVFEDTEVFARGVGESTDIVQKEMFTFEDKAGRSLTLRPEATAGICRAYIEHGMHKLPQPVKVWYAGPFFRHEAPQAGRFRQFTQIDAEAIGSDDPTLDAELILLLAEILERAGTGPSRLRLSSLGTPETRADYLEELKRFLRAREGELSEDVRALLDSAGMEYEIDPTLVRGLDYYTRTVFEVESERLGAQAALGGGGRYDGLVEELGGPPTPGVGWAVGVERMLLAAGDSPGEPAERLFIAIAKPDAARIGFQLARDLREAGFRVETEQAGRSLKGQLKQADRLGAFATVILGDSIEVKDMQTGHQREAGSLDQVLGLVREVTRA